MEAKFSTTFRVRFDNYRLTALDNRLNLSRVGFKVTTMLDNYDLDNDPIDYVGEDIVETVMELSYPNNLEAVKDEDLTHLYEDVYTLLVPFFTIREARKKRKAKKFTDAVKSRKDGQDQNI